MKITLLCNAGLALETDDAMLLVDLPNAPLEPFYTLPEHTWQQILNREKSFDKVKKAIAENDKTITLSCGQLTTGVTVKEWTAVLEKADPEIAQALTRRDQIQSFEGMPGAAGRIASI